MSKYLFIACHVDDIELSCGATIAKLHEQRHEITVVTLSHVYEGVDLINEWKESTEKMDVMRLHFDFTPRHFRTQRHDILQAFFKMEKPDFVFTHSVRDFHGDHSTVAREAIRAFKHSSIITFSGEWNHRQFNKNYFVPVTLGHVFKKIDYLDSYKSQKDKAYFKTDTVVSQMKVNGLICGHEFAEAFEVINYIQ